MRLEKYYQQISTSSEKNALSLLIAFCESFHKVYQCHSSFYRYNPLISRYWSFLIKSAGNLNRRGIDHHAYCYSIIKGFTDKNGVKMECTPFILCTKAGDYYYQLYQSKHKFDIREVEVDGSWMDKQYKRVFKRIDDEELVRRLKQVVSNGR